MKHITTFKDNDKEKATVVSSVIIEEQSNAEDTLCAITTTNHVEVNDLLLILMHKIYRFQRGI